LDLIHTFDRAQVERIGRQTIKGVGRHPQDLPGTNLVGGIAHERRLRIFAVDLDHLNVHAGLQAERYSRAKISRAFQQSRAAYDLPGANLRMEPYLVTERLRRVEGKHNGLVKELRRAFAQGELTATGECAVEGIRIVEEAIRS